jgi:inorganic pyrophosphatase
MSHSWQTSRLENTHQEFNSVIEIPLGSSVKYELDKKTGLIRMDRSLYSGVYYSANYGFIPQTLSGGRRPIGCSGSRPSSVAPLTVMRARATGSMTMIDGGNRELKIIAIATGIRNSTPLIR